MVKVRDREDIEREKLDEIKLKKTPTFILGMDEITGGGLPAGRTTLITGGAGSGKTLLGMEFIVRGIRQGREPGVFMAFEENSGELTQNFASLGMDLQALQEKKLLNLEYVKVDRSEIEETGEYDLEGLFIRLDYAIKSVKAKRVVLDTIETLFSALQDERMLRSELRRLFRWLQMRGVTSIVTGERGEKSISRFGLEEYVADCVIILDNRMVNQIATRRLRIVKYRGSSHGMNEYPFLIGDGGLSVLPITASKLDYPVSNKKVCSGVEALDRMLDGKGFYAGSTVLYSGTAGTGKTSFAASFAASVCENHGRCLYFAFEESQAQIIRNMSTIGIDLEKNIRNGRLRFEAVRPTYYGLEMHLVMIHKAINDFKPDAVVIDPISNLTSAGVLIDVAAMLSRLIDSLKHERITTLMTNLTAGTEKIEETEVGISSLVDTWILLSWRLVNGARQKICSVIKSRGMGHSTRAVPFEITPHGIEIGDNLGGRDAEEREAKEGKACGKRMAVDALRRRPDSAIH